MTAHPRARRACACSSPALASRATRRCGPCTGSCRATEPIPPSCDPSPRLIAAVPERAADELPGFGGLAEHWARSVFTCTYCDRWEHRDQPLAVLGADAVSDPRSITGISQVRARYMPGGGLRRARAPGGGLRAAQRGRHEACARAAHAAGASPWTARPSAIRRVCPAGRAVALRAPVSEAVWCGCLSHRRRRCGRRLSGLGRRTRCGQSGRRGCCGRRPRCGRQLADSSGQVPQVASGRAMTVLAFRGCGPGMPRGSSRPWATSSSAADRPTPGGRPRRAVPPLSAGCRIGRTARTAPWPAARGGRVRTPIVTTRQVAQRLHVAIPPRRLQPAATDDKKRLAWRRLVSTITSAPTANWSILA
jgi:hypothetical protein